jgi:hypothetical protein
MWTINAADPRRAGPLSILATGLFLVSVHSPVAAQQSVSWMNNANATVRGQTLQKTGGCDGCDDAGATSRQTIQSGDGYAEFTVTDRNALWMAGLTRRGSQTNFEDIDFAIRFNGAGRAEVIENGAYVDGDISYNAGDVFRVEVNRGRVRYLRNNQVAYQSTRLPQYPLVMSVALGTVGARVQNARIQTSGGTLSSLGSGSRLPTGRFNDLDVNRNNAIARNEWSGSRAEFNQLDENGDGILTRREYNDGNVGVGTTGRVDDFDVIDRNGNGTINRAEWQGPRADFNRLDLNLDGVLTRREWDNSDVGAIGTSAQLVQVDPRQRWTDTGLTVQAGDLITFDAQGTIQMRSDDRNDTASPGGSRLGRMAAGAPLPRSSAGSLIARIGDAGVAVLVGNRRTMTAPTSGRLYLGVNDDYLDDNSGEYQVAVAVEPR